MFTTIKAEVTDSANDGKVVAAYRAETKLSDTAIELGEGGSGVTTVGVRVDNLAKTEDKVVLILTIKNNNNVNMYLTPTVTHANVDTGAAISEEDSKFNVTTDLVAGTMIKPATDTEPNLVTLKITIQLKNDQITEAASEKFTVTISGTSDAPTP